MSAEPDIRREDGPSGGRYTATIAGADGEAEMTYSRAGAARLIIDHTGVPDSLRGTGIGEALVRRAVEDARADGLKIIPLCPFAAAMFRKHEELRDVLNT